MTPVLDQTTRHPRAEIATHIALMVTSALVGIVSAPMLLGLLRVVDKTFVQGWTMILGLWLALPIVALALLAAVLSLLGLVRGPKPHRARLLLWWAIAVCAVFASLLPRGGLNPYLDSPPPTFGVADALLMTSLILCILLPVIWLFRPTRVRH